MKKTVATIFLAFLVFVLEIILLFLMFLVGKQYAGKSITHKEYLNWNLQRESSVIRIYTKGSRYEAYINEATEKFNDLAPIFAVTDTVDNADVTCFDFEEREDNDNKQVLGVTFSNGRIGFNVYHLRDSTKNHIISVCLHELGHAIGLKHNDEKGSIMNSKCNPINFNKNDIERINKLYNPKKTKRKNVTFID